MRQSALTAWSLLALVAVALVACGSETNQVSLEASLQEAVAKDSERRLVPEQALATDCVEAGGEDGLWSCQTWFTQELGPNKVETFDVEVTDDGCWQAVQTTSRNEDEAIPTPISSAFTRELEGCVQEGS